MKQMAGGLPEEVGVLGSRGGPWFSLLRKNHRPWICGFFLMDFFIWVFNRKIGVLYPKMDGEKNGKPLVKWMIWGYHHFRKHPYRNYDKAL